MAKIVIMGVQTWFDYINLDFISVFQERGLCDKRIPGSGLKEES